MKKEMTQKILLFAVLGLFVLVMGLSVVSAETILDKLLVFSQSPGHFWDNWFQGTSFAQFLLFLLVTLVVFAIMEFVPFIKSKGWLAFGISVIIGILSIAYIKPEEVYTILLSYTSFGIALTSLIPFLLVAVISKKLHDKGHTTFSKVLWIVIGVSVLMKWITADTKEIGTFGQVAFPLAVILILIMILWENKFYYFIFKRQIKDFREQYNTEQIADLRGELDRMGEEIRATTDSTVETTLVTKYNKKAAKLRAFGVNWKDWGK
ncbi:MAG: hypothetical protein WCP89_03865 [archaeon]